MYQKLSSAAVVIDLNADWSVSLLYVWHKSAIFFIKKKIQLIFWKN